ncbi:MAG: hypothetical protein V1747_04645 [Candidatus Omnitrophota bacterium]
MKLKILIWFIAISIVLSVNGYAGVIGQDNAEVQQHADPIIDNILQGMANDDYFQYTKDFDQHLKAIMSKDRFIKKRKEVYDWVGSYLYREYLGFINTQSSTVIFWKGAFDNTKDDILIRLTLSEDQGRYFVKGLFYQ